MAAEAAREGQDEMAVTLANEEEDAGEEEEEEEEEVMKKRRDEDAPCFPSKADGFSCHTEPATDIGSGSVTLKCHL